MTTININGTLLDLQKPCVMGILNITPDSFYAESRKTIERDIVSRARQILEEGGTIIDVGAYSTRPGAEEVSEEEEMKRLHKALGLLRKELPDAIVSVDTFRADVAKMCVEEYGVGIVNDISGGTMDNRMFETVAKLNVPYVLTHIKGTPQDMQDEPHYDDLIREVFLYFSEKINRLHDMGLNDIILDPGFGFGKTLAHNYELMSNLQMFREFEVPILVGISRKSMIYKLLDTTPQEALNGTTALNTIALLKGANILRVHDVKAAAEVVAIVECVTATSYK
ncbi:dihydropteroate synthase [Pseudoprevotella muciniphila]|uniref:dihydropteroate synthase n=1 Tax=Pseudoprevotella muciniphila TaxID=2133944 RepID=A0A5P8E8P0_9BACT|nr:dihydropteroate synthase [Pseudoprevotella muciniphila]QFQ13333.1 dihydropteroate synthase [Pseudoprevotella muciniphila]